VKNIYLEELSEDIRNGVLILSPENELFSFYDLVKLADLVITRASSVAEESILMNKPVIAYDLFSDGPSSALKLLMNAQNFHLVIEGNTDLGVTIAKLAESERPNSLFPENLESEITYRLDGNSTSRVVDILKQLSQEKR
jgi:CDP-glycerol glycerophosphotransferase (TagB/SpsB family)